MIEPTQADIGRSVVYTGNYGGPIEEGIITSFNETTVFVRYRTQHPGANGQATSREDLNWLLGEKEES